MVVLLAGATAVVACGGGSSYKPTPIGVPSATENVKPTIDVRRTGIHQIDSLLGAIAAHDEDALVSFMHLTNVPCRATPELLDTQPQCPSGTQDGFLIDAFPIASCEGSYVPAQQSQANLEALLQSYPLDESRVYAVYPVYTIPGLFAAAKPKYAIVMSLDAEARGRGWILFVGAEGLVGAEGGCSMTPEALVDALRLQGALIAPPIPTPDATANARRSGIVEVDAIIDAVLSGDADRILSLVYFQPVACIGPTPASLGALFCEGGEREGDEILVVPWSGCEGGYLRQGNGFSGPTGLLDPSIGLFSVFKSNEEYGVVFSRLGPDSRPAGITVRVGTGRIVGVNFDCGQPARDLASHVTPADFILPPP